jgi:hypothetical protein
MPSTYTVNLGIEKPATGEQSGTWGDTTNVNFDILDQAINGAERVTLTSAGSSGSPNSLQITNGATSDGRNKWLEFYSSSDLGGSAFVQLDPNDAEKIVFVRNSLAGSQSVILFQGTYNAARDLEVPAGVDMVVKFDGGGASAATVTDVFTKLRATEITTPTLTAGTADINGGTVDGAVIGGSSAAAITGTTVTANTSLNIAGDGATVTGIKDEDDMSSNSPTKLATQQSIKAYVDSQVGTVDTWAEVLANGATSGSTNPEVTAGQALKTNTINETSAGSGVTIDSVLLKDDVVNATDIETSSISANDGTAAATIANSTGVITIASSVLTTTDINGGSIDGTNIGASSTGTGAFTTLSATGNLTVDTDTLFVDASANTVGIGTTSNVASYKLQVQGANLLVGNAQSNNQISVTRTGSGATAIHLQAYSSNPAVSWDSGTLRFLNGGPLTINEDGGDYDFRVESNSNTHMFFVDAGNNRIGINNSSPSGLFELQNTSSTTFDATDTTGQVSNGATLSVQNLSDDTNSFSQILLRTRNASKSVSRIASLVNGTGTDLVFVNEPQGSDPAERLRITKDGKFGFNTSVPVSDVTISSSDDPVLTLRDGKSGSSWVAGDGLGQLEYYTSDGTGIADHAVARIKTISGGSNSAGPDGVIVFETAGYNSTPTERMRIGNTDNTVGGVIINEGSYNQDFRVESDSNTHALFVDAGNSRVGINKSAPAASLHVLGPADTSAISTSSTPAARINNGGAISNWIGANGYNYGYIQAIQDDGSNNIKPIVLQPLGGNVGVGITSGISAFMHLYGNFEGNYALKFDNTKGTGQVFGVRSHGTNGERLAFYDVSNSKQMMAFSGNADEGTIFNEDSNNLDFRVESDGYTHAFFVDAGNDNVGIKINAPQSALHINENGGPQSSGDMTTGLIVSNGTAGTAIQMGTNDASGFGYIKSAYVNSSQTGRPLLLYTGTAKAVSVESGETVINDDSLDRDFRVESDSSTHALFVDGGENNIGVRNSSPLDPLHILINEDNNANRLTGGNSADLAGGLKVENDNTAVDSFAGMFLRSNTYDVKLVASTGTASNEGEFMLLTDTAGGDMALSLYIDQGETVFNEDSRDQDFRVESNNNSTALVVDAGSDYVSVGQQSVTNPGNGNNNTGWSATTAGRMWASTGADHGFNRTSDGVVLSLRSGGAEEGTISISGTTCSFNGGHLSRWSQPTDNTRISGLLKGTVMTNLDQMASWPNKANEQLNCMAVSSVEGDANVAGVFVNWDEREGHIADMNIAMTGDMIIRIAQGTTVQRGDLLMSAGDGTAKAQGDDIVRSKTIAKVTSTHVTCTYDDGTYCVPCVLMAC